MRVTSSSDFQTQSRIYQLQGTEPDAACFRITVRSTGSDTAKDAIVDKIAQIGMSSRVYTDGGIQVLAKAAGMASAARSEIDRAAVKLAPSMPVAWYKFGSIQNPCNPLRVGCQFRGLHGSRICYGLPSCLPPCTDPTGFPAVGDFYYQASNGKVALPVAGYNYNSDWTPLLVGLTPTGMAASLAAPEFATKKHSPLTNFRGPRANEDT
jgi:hypothetical protein